MDRGTRCPIREGQVGGDRDGGSFFAFGDDLEQQFGSAWVDLDVAEFVEAEQVEAAVAGNDSGQDSFVGGFDEFVHEPRRERVSDPEPLSPRPRCPGRFWDNGLFRFGCWFD
jgi:hypothetical protein